MSDVLDNFWLNDTQWAAVAPHLPMVHTGPVRQDDRRIISGIVHRLCADCRWRQLPGVYGPYTTVFNQYNRWRKRGVWQRLLAVLVTCGDPPQFGVTRAWALEGRQINGEGRRTLRQPDAHAAHARFAPSRLSMTEAVHAPS